MLIRVIKLPGLNNFSSLNFLSNSSKLIYELEGLKALLSMIKRIGIVLRVYKTIFLDVFSLIISKKSFMNENLLKKVPSKNLKVLLK